MDDESPPLRLSQAQSFLPTLTEELSEELRMSSSRHFTLGSESSEGGGSDNNNNNNNNDPNKGGSPRRTSSYIAGGGEEGLEPLKETETSFNNNNNTNKKTSLPVSTSDEAISTISRPLSLGSLNPPHRSISMDTGTTKFQRKGSGPNLTSPGSGIGASSSTQNARWDNTVEPLSPKPSSGTPRLLSRLSLGGGATGSGIRAGRHSLNASTYNLHGNRPRLNNNNNNNLTRSNSFRRSLSLVERNDGSSLASNITRKSNNIRNTLARKSTTAFRFNNKNNSSQLDESGRNSILDNKFANVRLQSQIGFSVGDAVLIIHNREENMDFERSNRLMMTICVNRFGYPPGEGTTIEEQQGPYIYVLGKVTQVHYEENAKFYTVQREDTGEDIRGDADFMEPILSKEGEEAARRAAADFAMGIFPHPDMHGDEGLGAIPSEANEKAIRVVENLCVIVLLPFIWLYDCFVFIIGARLFRWGERAYQAVRNQAHLFLNGMPPYEFTTRITTVNLVVLCSIWYNFIDQARLAFFPTSADDALAVINFGIWTVLAVELTCEVFIRPDGYSILIQSDKAYTPTTVRYISSIHLLVEFVSLAFFVPEFLCLFQRTLTCNGRPEWGFVNAASLSVTGTSASKALAGRAIFACIRLRVFGLVRHWKNWWINRTFLKRGRPGQLPIGDAAHPNKSHSGVAGAPSSSMVQGGGAGVDKVEEGTAVLRSEEKAKLLQKQRDAALINASNIGTALMVTNSYRALTILCAIIGLFPMITLINYKGVANSVAMDMVDQLQATNVLVSVEDESSCTFLVESVQSWLESFAPREKILISSDTNDFVIALAIQPARCIDDFEVISYSNMVFSETPCSTIASIYEMDLKGNENCILGALDDANGDELSEIAQNMGLRVGNLGGKTSERVYQTLEQQNGTSEATFFAVGAQFNKTHSVESSALASFILQLCLLVTVLGGLTVLREDAKDLVLGPLRSMLKIVARYAKNPLSQGNSTSRDNLSVVSDLESEFSSHVEDDENSQDDGFGTYETEQLITAVAKITDLLRKCWGVAGADIISTNLASREGALAEVFNPTVPGKSVYALFAFAAINGFDHALKCLGGDVMILINDVANVLHGEVFRWGFGDSGQCNKNLGAAFLMVFRIGLVKEVVEKLEEATKVVFSTSEAKRNTVKKRNRNSIGHLRKDTPDPARLNAWQKVAVARNAAGHLKAKHHNKQHDAMTDAMQLSLQSLPGISTFTDRAVIGMLKSFSGIHRDNKLRAWSRDFRLSAGVGTFSVDMIFGMDAGWAVEGAVGSEYKIDATYLSPHVNMASRMMSACKHYGVTILLSEAVQELMSDAARSKLRNLDRVTVKGSTKIQNIYTYDARHKGADFFLFSRSDEQADMEAERYSPNIWHNDQDLKAMRHHVTEDFELEFNAGMKAYYDGDWPTAIKRLENANEIMVDAAMEEGYLHDELDDSPDRKELYRSEISDGPCSYLVHFMKSKKGVAPPGWAGWHPLLSK